MAIKLYDLVGSDVSKPFSPQCWKIRMALAHKGVEWESIPTRFTEIKDIENGGLTTVPVINHGGRIVSDSFQIALYLRSIYPDLNARLFAGEGGVATTRFIEGWTQTQMHFWIMKWAILDIWKMQDDENKEYFRTSREKALGKTLEEIVADREDRIADLKGLLHPIRYMLKHQPFIGGKSPIFADYIVFGAFQWLRVCSGLHMIAKDDPVLEWLERMLDLHDGLGRTVEEATS